MATLREVIAKIQAHAVTAGAEEAPNDPTEAALSFPFSVCYPETGSIGAEAAAQRKDQAILVLDFHVSRNLLPQDIQAALPFYESFPDLLINDPTLGGTVDTINMARENAITWQFGEMEYGGQKTIGFRLRIPVKIRSNTSA